MCGALDMGLPLESLDVTLFPDAENLYTMPDVVLYKPLDIKCTVSPIRIFTPSMSLITRCWCTYCGGLLVSVSCL